MDSIQSRKQSILWIICLVVLIGLVTCYLGGLFLSETDEWAVCFIALPVSLCILGIALYNFGILRYIDIKIILAFGAWVIICTFLNLRRAWAMDNLSWAATAIPGFLVPILFPYITPKEKRLSGLEIMAWIYTAFFFIISVIGIYSVLSAKDLFDGGVYMDPVNRLWLFDYFTNIGDMALVAFLLTLFLLSGKRRWPVTVLLVVMAFSFHSVIVLTDVRTAKIAVIPALFLFGYLKTEQIHLNMEKTKKILCSVLAGVVLCTLVFLMFSVSSKLMSKIRSNSLGKRQETVSAETITERKDVVYMSLSTAKDIKTGMILMDENGDDSSLSEREIGLDGISERLSFWEKVLQKLIENKEDLLFGTSPAISHELYTQNILSNFHNGYLAVLVDFGIIGFVLFMLYLVIWVVKSVKLMFLCPGKADFMARFLPAVGAGVCMEALTEEMFLTSVVIFPSAVILLLVCSCTFVFVREADE